MLICIDVKFIFDSVRLGLSSSENILQIAYVALAVFAMFSAIISPSSSRSFYFWNEWSARHFCCHNQNNSTSFSGLLGNGALTCI